jgi:hypothetical protein
VLEYWSIDVLEYWGVAGVEKEVTGTPCACIFSITPSLHFFKTFVEALEKSASSKLMENVQMQGFRDPEE